MRLPADFTTRIIDVYGDRGREWLARLPHLVDELCSRWRLRPGETCELSYNFVVSAAGIEGPDAVLKLGVPGPALRREMDALAWFDGQWSVRLLAADAAQGAMLLEHLSPGTRLSDLEDDDEETALAAGLMASLWKPAPADHAFPTTNEWARELDNLRRMFSGDTGPLPRQLVERAEHLFAELSSDGLPLVVLHGDLHHDNILAAERRPWLAIDPKGVVGEPAYEVGAFLRNPMSRLLNASRPQDLIARRIDLLTERLGLDRQRLLAFAFAQLILSAWWMYEDHGDGWQPAIALAEAIEPQGP